MIKTCSIISNWIAWKSHQFYPKAQCKLKIHFITWLSTWKFNHFRVIFVGLITIRELMHSSFYCQTLWHLLNSSLKKLPSCHVSFERVYLIWARARPVLYTYRNLSGRFFFRCICGSHENHWRIKEVCWTNRLDLKNTISIHSTNKVRNKLATFVWSGSASHSWLPTVPILKTTQ